MKDATLADVFDRIFDRARCKREAEAAMAEQSKQPTGDATAEELLAAFPEAPDAFLLMAIRAKLSIPAAQDALIVLQKDILAMKDREIADRQAEVNQRKAEAVADRRKRKPGCPAMDC